MNKFTFCSITPLHDKTPPGGGEGLEGEGRKKGPQFLSNETVKLKMINRVSSVHYLHYTYNAN